MAALMAATDQRSVSRTALVTGAARGIGLATAQALLAAGHRVAIIDRDAETLRTAAAQLPSDRVLAVVQDVAHPDAGKKSTRRYASAGSLRPSWSTTRASLRRAEAAAPQAFSR